MKSYKEKYLGQDKPSESHLKEQQRKLEEERKILNACFSTPMGEEALKIIMRKCGFHAGDGIPLNTEGAPLVMAYARALRELYSWIRVGINKKTLAKVEVDYVSGE